MFEKYLWKSDSLSKDAASKNQLPGFYVSGTLVENGLNRQNKRTYLHLLALTVLHIKSLSLDPDQKQQDEILDSPCIPNPRIIPASYTNMSSAGPK